jgi:internalin A
MAEEFEGLSIALGRIAREARERTGFLDLGQLGLTELPTELLALTDLRRLGLGAGILGEAGEWCEAVSDIAPNRLDTQLRCLAHLPNLAALSVRGAALTTLAGLAGLNRLQQLDCSETQIDDLSPVAELRGLKSFNCWGTPVRDLSPLAALNGLQKLQCSHTQVTNLAPLVELRELQGLYCTGTKVSDLKPLAGLHELKELYCANTGQRPRPTWDAARAGDTPMLGYGGQRPRAVIEAE